MKKIIIIGAGGFGKEIAWGIRRVNQVKPSLELVGFCDDNLSRSDDVGDIAPLLGSVDSVVEKYRECGYICAIGSNKSRCKIMQMLESLKLEVVSVVDPSAVVAEGVDLGAGSYIGINAVVSVGCRVGRGCIVNHNATVGHDAVVGDYAQLCPGVALSGGCMVGEGALLGSNSCTIPCKKIGAWSTLGAGGVLLSDLEDGGSRVRIR